VDIFKKLAGMNSDHCSKERKDAQLLEKEKMQAIYQTVGEDAFQESTNEELLPVLMEARSKMIEAVGGTAKWKALSESTQADHEAKMMEEAIKKLGKDAFENLDDNEKRIMKLFIWAGCGCHKDLNSVHGGNTAMMAWWDDNEIDGPVLLANRDNKATLKDYQPGSDTLTPDQERAIEKSTRGGIKATKLAGDILNNKDDKKGYHDDFRWWWATNVQEDFTFPGTSNNRFQSHCEAAAVLILHLQKFIQFMKYIKAKKKNQRFSNMEQNLWNALHCPATITELVVLALYSQAVSHPYLRKIRSSKKINMLDLGPFHKKIYKHIKKIIQDPSLLIGCSVKHETGAADHLEWESPDVMAAIQALAPELPYLEPLLVEFFHGAAKTWKRFTSEFAPGGLIDEATVEEKDAAWMPPTNDANEGALGAYRVVMRKQPCLHQDQFNAWYMIRKNATEEFAQRELNQPEDLKFIHKWGRAGGLKEQEMMRKKALVDHNEARIQKRKDASERRAAKAKRVAAVKLIFDLKEISMLKGDSLNMQLQAFKLAGAPNLQCAISKFKADEKRQELQAAIISFNAGNWKPIQEGGEPSDIEDTDTEDADTEDADTDDDGESSWEDLDF